MGIKGRQYPKSQSGAPLVVFDFDHTLYDGDSGSHLFKWLIRRAWWRTLLALLAAPLFGPMVAFLPTRRRGIGAFVWIGTVGFHRRRDLDELIARYVAKHEAAIRPRLLPIALDVLHRRLLDHYEANIAVLTRPYPGTLAALDTLAARGVRIAVVTNKLESLARKVIDALIDKYADEGIATIESNDSLQSYPVRAPMAVRPTSRRCVWPSAGIAGCSTMAARTSRCSG